MSIGLMTAAALMPAKPVPRPAPMPAAKQIKGKHRKASLFVILV